MFKSWWYGSNTSINTKVDDDDDDNDFPDIGEQINNLTVKRDHLYHKSTMASKQAKTLIRSDRGAASKLLQQSKRYKAQADLKNNQIMNLEQTLFAIESTSSVHDQVKIMKKTTDIMKTQLKVLDPVDIDMVRDDMNDLALRSSEIIDSISIPMFNTTVEEDDDIARQLDEWDTEPIILPDVSNSKLETNENVNKKLIKE